MLRNLDVVVAGGGDSALQETLALLGPAGKITIVTDGPDLTAQDSFRSRVLASPKVSVRTGARIAEILGPDRVEGVRLEDGTQIACTSVFVFTGMKPNSGLAAGLVDLAGDGRVVVDEAMRTKAPGLLAAGTLRAGSTCRAAAAAQDGAIAAQAAQQWLLTGTWDATGG